MLVVKKLLDLQDTKFNLGVEPLYKHFIGDKNCDASESELMGQISHETCGNDCGVICYNINSSEIINYYNPNTQSMVEFINTNPGYYMADSTYECLAVGNTPIECVGVQEDGCYIPILGVTFEQCSQFSAATQPSRNENYGCGLIEDDGECNSQFSCYYDYESTEQHPDGHCVFDLNSLRINCSEKTSYQNV